MIRLPTDDPSHRRIMAEPLGVVDILVPGSRPNTACRNIPNKNVPAVFAGTGVGEPFASRFRKAESIVKLA